MVVFKDLGEFGEPCNFLGKGTYGEVYATDKGWAIKTTLLSPDVGIPETTLREIAVMRFIDHPNLTKLHGLSIISQESIGIVMNLAQETLHDVHYSRKKEILKQILCGVEYLHAQSIWHRDIKPQNILVFADGHVELCDFGLTKFFAAKGTPLTGEVCTLWYRAPELLLGQEEYDGAIDIWSIAVIFLTMIFGDTCNPLCGATEVEQLHRIFGVLGTPPTTNFPGKIKLELLKAFPQYSRKLETKLQATDCTRDEQDLLCKLLAWPDQRLTARKALNHRYFGENFEIPCSAAEQLQLLTAGTPVIKRVKNKYRYKCLAWMWEAKKYIEGFEQSSKLSYRALFHAFQLFDLFSENHELTNENAQGYAIAALFIASKLHEFDSLDPNDLIALTKSQELFRSREAPLLGYTIKDLFYYEQEIVTALDAKLLMPTAIDYYHHFVPQKNASEEKAMLCITALLLNNNWFLDWSLEKLVRYALDISGVYGYILLFTTLRNDIYEYLKSMPEGKLRDAVHKVFGF